MKPIFLHASWRAASTYVWSKFRSNHDCFCFNEPFHENIQRLTSEMANNLSTVEYGNHPTLERPLMAEYEAVISNEGVDTFKEHFSLRDYFSYDFEGEQKRYIDSLVFCAKEHNQIPVFGFVRSQGRVEWMKGAFDAIHIVQLRNPCHQWASAHRLKCKYDDPYISTMPYLVLGQAETGSMARTIADELGIPAISAGSVPEQIIAYRDLYANCSAEFSYTVFMYFYVLSLMNSLPHADIVLDIDLLSSSCSYRKYVEDEINRLSGIKVDFSDVSISNHDLNEWDVDYKRINDDVASRLLKDDFSSLVVKKHLTGNTTQALGKESGNEVINLKLREANELFLDSRVRNIEREYKVACERAAFLEKSLLKVHDSVAWKITKPIRFFSSLIQG